MINANEARRLRDDTAFLQFVAAVRQSQINRFLSSGSDDVEIREDAHAIVRALNLIEAELDAAEAAELLENRK
tara:strand:+ start:1022 stop:1240 length:219 start_codon:yes stop_codon:yes gene_type:complete